MIWIIGGTKETSYLLDEIDGRLDYIVTVTTYAGKEVVKYENVIVSKLDYHGMIEFIKANNIDKIVDMSHPYAREATLNAKKASKELNIDYIRYTRNKTKTDSKKQIIYLKNIEECTDYLANVNGTVLFTTGIKNISDFEKVKGNNRFIYRVLPSMFSIQECLDNNIEMKDIIAILGPFSEEFNMTTFREYGADYVIMKDSGDIGGTKDKISACEKLDIKSIIIGREEEQGINDIGKLVEMIS